jgi:hypothetical protein
MRSSGEQILLCTRIHVGSAAMLEMARHNSWREVGRRSLLQAILARSIPTLRRGAPFLRLLVLFDDSSPRMYGVHNTKNDSAFINESTLHGVND